MRKFLSMLPAAMLALSLGSFAMIGTGCDGKFAGPPGGSAVGTPGTEPLFGVTVFTFACENPTITGFYNDVWYIDPGRDSDDGPGGTIGAWFADTIQALATAGFTGYLIKEQSPTHIEVNNQYPLMLSFMSQWFRRNADGTRIRERDQFGFLIWSPKSLDINFVTAPVERIVLPSGQVIYTVNRQAYPAGSQGSVMFGWTSPPPNSPGDFPPPQSRFLNKNYSECGMVLLTRLLPAGAPQLTQAMGVTMNDNENNENVENLGAVPQNAGGGFTQVPTPTGVFGDLFADAYKQAPVLKPTTPGHTEEEAVVEYSRHLGALHTNLIAQAIGLNSGKVGTLMDPKQVIFQNGYGYAFIQEDLNALDTKHLPGKGRDPNPQSP
ncbi:MAG: hypothetical protein HS108_06115 [Planctomycetes bacterium]|jgi:hypothetical protein|nr:hypothetical protein [Planctomycetota bacterium]MCL4730745.1 hypothetical protein [Planctomycetota bacterium]